MVLFLSILQATATIAMVAMRIFDPFIDPDGKLTKIGRIAFYAAAITLAMTVPWIEHEHRSALEHLRTDIRRLHEADKDKLGRIYELGGRIVMTAPRGPEIQAPAMQPDTIQIASPATNTLVDQRAEIAGTVRDPSVTVWVVVHPLESSAYWVQPQIAVQTDGTWTVLAYFGRAGTIDSGKTFEVVAVVDPENELEEGQIFDRWPAARAASAAIFVKRR